MTFLIGDNVYTAPYDADEDEGWWKEPFVTLSNPDPVLVFDSEDEDAVVEVSRNYDHEHPRGTQLPVIFLRAANEENEVVAGFNVEDAARIRDALNVLIDLYIPLTDD